MADISTGRQRGIVPFVDETTGRLPDQYLPQGVIDLQGDLEQAVTDAGASATAAKASETAAARSAQTATEQVSSIGDSVEQAAASATAAQQSATNAASSASNASQSASSASTSASQAGESTSQANGFASTASQAATTATGAASNASASATAAQQSASDASSSAQAAKASETTAAGSASAAKISETNAAASATEAREAVDGFGLEAGTTTTGEPGTDAAVEIEKQGTKYTANFTIPRGDKGDPGDLTTVAHDDTLTGDGTSGSPLGVGAYALLDDNTDFNNVRTFGTFLKRWGFSAVNTPIAYSSTQYLLWVNREGAPNTGDVIQVIIPIGGVNTADKIYFRYFSNSAKWSDWKQLVTSNDLSNYVPLSTYQALEAKVQALEAKTTYKQITSGTDLHTLFGANGFYLKQWGTPVENAPNSVTNSEWSKYLISVVSQNNDGYMRLDPIAGFTDFYYLQKTNGSISSWYKITATEITAQEGE